jgi:hypothetical protein
MQKSFASLISRFTIATACFGLGGCASFGTTVNLDNCTERDTGSLKIPLFIQFGRQGEATFKNTCQAGYNIGILALIGQRPDGTLAPASIIMFHKKYSDLERAIENGEDRITGLSETKAFADHFLGSLSGGRLNAAILKTMYSENIIDPSLVNQDGTLKPKEKFICEGKGLQRTCTPTTPPPNPS